MQSDAKCIICHNIADVAVTCHMTCEAPALGAVLVRSHLRLPAATSCARRVRAGGPNGIAHLYLDYQFILDYT